MSKSDRKRELTRGRRAGTRQQRFLTNRPAGEKPPADMHRWPIERAYVPDPDVWRVSGYGFAGVWRRRPDGKLATAYFQLELPGGGIVSMSGKLDADPATEDDHLRTYVPRVPAFQEGPADLATRYVRGAYAWGEARGYRWPAEESRPFLGLVPPMSGTRHWWLQQFVDPDGGLVPPALAGVIRDNPTPANAPRGRVLMILTEATFDVPDGAAAVRALEEAAPAFARAGADGDRRAFTLSREFPGEDGGPPVSQPIGDVAVDAVAGPGRLVAKAKALSLAAGLVRGLKDALGGGDGAPRLRTVTWRGSRVPLSHTATFGDAPTA